MSPHNFFYILFAAAALGIPAATAAYGYGPPEPYGVPRSEKQVAHRPAVESMAFDTDESLFAVVTTELSPAALVVNHTREQVLFGRLDRWGLGGPTGVAYMRTGSTLQSQTAQGIRIDDPEMTEPWIIVWFQGARGWTRWDSPWLVVLQKKPSLIETGAFGLRLEFPREAGVIALMPLHGYSKPSPSAIADPYAALNIRSLTTFHWSSGIPGETVERARWWSRVLRFYPIHCRETFSVDPSKDRLTIHDQFTWFPIHDEWKTDPLKFAPLSPSLALALRDPRFPMRVAGKVTDPELFTPYGPYIGVEGKDRVEVAIDALQYLHETEVQQEPDLTAHPEARPALEMVLSAMSAKFSKPDGKWGVDFGEENFCWAAMSDRYYPKALAYVDPAIRENARKSLRSYFGDWVLKEERFRPFKDMLLLTGPGIGTWGGYDDAGKFSSNLLETVWSYAHYTGDWDLVKERWRLLKRLFVTPLESDWKTFGRAAIAEIGDEAAPPMAMARMAYRIGDGDMYRYAGYLFCRELLHHFIKQNGASYFRERQPYHSMESMPENVYLTNLWGDTAGWQIDGPTYPKETGERQYNNRWVRFGNEDVARFHRDRLADEVRRELDGLVAGNSPYRLGRDDGHIAPSMERLRSLLLNESPAELAKLTPAEKRSAQPDSGRVAMGLAFLRTTRPVEYARIIPKGGRPSPFEMGLERQVTGGFSGLVQNVVWETRSKEGSGEAYWPVPVWHFWKPPVSPDGHPAGERWPFGEMRPAGPERPKAGHSRRLNWNTQVTTFDF